MSPLLLYILEILCNKDKLEYKYIIKEIIMRLRRLTEVFRDDFLVTIMHTKNFLGIINYIFMHIYGLITLYVKVCGGEE